MKKGPLFESQVVDYLRSHGFPWAERRVQGGSKDRGDVGGVPAVTLEVKNCARLEPAAWVDEAAVEAANAGTEVYAVVAKRRGKGDVGQSYVIMPLSVFVGLVR